ncbi:MAG: ATP-grasp domain-containing protein, partial [Hyphomicrobium sp.]
MNIHEYQAKQLYREYGIPTPNGFEAFTVEDAVSAAKKLPGPV